MWSSLKKPYQRMLVGAFWLALWQLAATGVDSALLLPGPIDALLSLLSLSRTASFWRAIAATLGRIGAGYLLGALAGTAIGVTTFSSPLLRDILSPLRAVAKATPVTSFIILVLLWLTAEAAPVLIVFIMVTPMFWATVYQGMLSADAQLLEMAAVFKLGRKKTMRHIYLPHILPQYIATSSTALGFAWKSGVAAEVIAAPAFSIGRGIYESKLYVETPALFAWTLAVILLSVLLEKLIVALLRRARA